MIFFFKLTSNCFQIKSFFALNEGFFIFYSLILYIESMIKIRGK